MNIAEFVVSCLEAEGVEYVFGIPGEENIKFVRAIHASKKIRFILTRHEQGASFMADIYGRLTGRAGVCTATLGPGAINLLLGVSDAQTDSTPLVAISAQVGLDRIYKESHQIVDLVAMFKPVTKWADTILTPHSVPEMVRKAFHVAQTERPGATYLAIPQDLEGVAMPADLTPLALPPHTDRARPDTESISKAASLLKQAKRPVLLIGHGVVRGGHTEAVRQFAERHQIPAATTFMAKGAISDASPLSMGVIGFMRHDYENFAFDDADVILSVGYELQEFAPARINPHGNKSIIHINTFDIDIDACYNASVNLVADIGHSVDALSIALGDKALSGLSERVKIRALLDEERATGQQDTSFPPSPQHLVTTIREALAPEDIVLADTGAIKMWMARLYPTYEPLTCLTSNGLSTMSFALPGAMGAMLAKPNRKVLAVMGDGSFLMNSQEIETAVREKIDLKILVWVDGSYGLIKWKMDIEEGAHDSVDFGNPDFVKYAESFGAKGYRVTKAGEFKSILEAALAEPGVSLIACPVDYKHNMALVKKLGELTIGL